VDQFEQHVHIGGGNGGWIQSSRIQGMGLLLGQLLQDLQDDIAIFVHHAMQFHGALEFLFHAFAMHFGSFQQLIIGRWQFVSLLECHHVGTGPIGKGQIQRHVIVIVLLQGAFWISIVQGFDDFKGCIVMSGIVQGQIAVIVFFVRHLPDIL